MQSSDYAVLGAGLMGVGIATHFIRHGHEVLLYEPDPQRREEASAVASGILAELSDVGQFDRGEREAALARLRVTGDLNAVAHARLLIEAIPERLELKHALYEQLEGLIADDAVIASNTSGLPPDELAARMTHPQRLLIAHFWHPPHLIPLVEIVPGRAIWRRCRRCSAGWRWRRCCWNAPRRGLSATGCSLRCCARRCTSSTAASPALKWWIR